MALISLTDIQEYKPISSNIDATKKLNPFIKEAQQFDLRPILGDEFYLDLVADIEASPSLTKYADLWNGNTFTVGSDTYENAGLKVVLVYYAYARYLNRANTNQTAFSVVQKNNPNSESISEAALARLVGQATSGAKDYEARIKFYLDNNASLYPLYTCQNDNRRTGGIRITAVR
jgi:hypothetical protein